MPKRTKLPQDAFADSPLRNTQPSAPVEPTQPPATGEQGSEVATAPVVAATEGTPLKITVYLPQVLVDTVEDEVYQRRRAGDRSAKVQDLYREIVQDWATRRSRKRAG